MEKKSLIWSSIVVVVSLFAVFYFASSQKADVAMTTPTTDTPRNIAQTTPAPTPTSPSTQPSTSTAAVPATTSPIKKSIYKDGTYTAVGAYGSPAGGDSIAVSITLKNDIIVDSIVTTQAIAENIVVDGAVYF